MCVLASGLSAWADGDSSCPMVHIVPERLPDLTMPRSGHSIFYANGELTLVGGHTTNFVPTPTAEYFADGKWHPMTMAYCHDDGFAVTTSSGEVIIGGGHAEPLGVGQTYVLERYDPKTHTFEGFGCLDRRRVLANATLLPDGRVIIAGNHYAADAIACFDGSSQVQHVKDEAQERSNPYILPTADDDALILGGNDQYDKRPDTVWVDRVKGDAFRVPLLEQWQLVYTDQPFNSYDCSIADLPSHVPSDGHSSRRDSVGPPSGGRSYLLTAVDKSGQMAIVVARDTCFSLLPTVCPIPMRCQWGDISYKGPVVVDRERQRGYVMGVDSLYTRQYVLAIDYSKMPAELTLYYTDVLPLATITIPMVTPDGDLILAGGIPNDNYKPLSTVWLYHFGTASMAGAAASSSFSFFGPSLVPLWLWLVIVVAALAALAYIILYIRRRRQGPNGADAVPARNAGPDPRACPPDLMGRICQLMDDEQLYLRSDLKLQDVAVRLSTNSSYVSECINSGCGQSFSQFVNTYRVRHAQELLHQQPDMKTSTVAAESGFSSEVSFFRNFKIATGMTPREWKENVKRLSFP
jgi:AraC-like DNA-binding protein